MSFSYSAAAISLTSNPPNPDNRYFLISPTVDIVEHMSIYLGMGYSSNPLIFEDQITGTSSSLLGSITDTNFGGVIKIAPNLQLGANMTLQTQNFSSKNIGFSPIMPYLELKYRFHKNFALIPNIQLPTSATKDFDSGIVNFDIGVPNGSYGLNLVYEHNFGGLLMVLNGGYSIAPDNVVLNIDESSAFRYGVHLYHPLNDRMAVTSEFYGRVTPSNTPAEFLAGFTYKKNNSIFKMAAGTGNFSGAGSNDFKTMVMFTYNFDKPEESLRKPIQEVDRRERVRGDQILLPTNVPKKKEKNNKKVKGITIPDVPEKKPEPVIKKEKPIQKEVDPRQKQLEDGMEYQKAPDVLYPESTEMKPEEKDLEIRDVASDGTTSEISYLSEESDPVPQVSENKSEETPKPAFENSDSEMISNMEAKEKSDNNINNFFSPEEVNLIKEFDDTVVIESPESAPKKKEPIELEMSMYEILNKEKIEAEKKALEEERKKQQAADELKAQEEKALAEKKFREEGQLVDMKTSDIKTEDETIIIKNEKITIISLPKYRGSSYLDNQDMPLPAKPDPEEESKIIIESSDIESADGPEFMENY